MIPVPYNDHIESYFGRWELFGLTGDISPDVVSQAEEMTQGAWAVGSTKTLGRLLRTEYLAWSLASINYFVYTRKTDPYELKSLQFASDAPTAYRISERIRALRVKKLVSRLEWPSAH